MSAPTSIFDVAKAIIEREFNPSTMKIHKLSYFIQGWSLAWVGVPMFEEPLEAWASGPVCRPFYDTHVGIPSLTKMPEGTEDRLRGVTARQQAIIESVVDSFTALVGYNLAEMAQRQSPWVDVRSRLGLGPSEKCSEEIPLAAIKAHFDAQWAVRDRSVE